MAHARNIATAYIGHQAGRYAYILCALAKLLEEGQKSLKYALYTPEELEQYGIFASSSMTEREIRAANHNSWVLALNNEYGILDWMISHRKK